MDVKKILIVVVCVFAIYFVFSQPQDAAVIVRDTGELAFDVIRNGAESLREFANTLITS